MNEIYNSYSAERRENIKVQMKNLKKKNTERKSIRRKARTKKEVMM